MIPALVLVFRHVVSLTLVEERVRLFAMDCIVANLEVLVCHAQGNAEDVFDEELCVRCQHTDVPRASEQSMEKMNLPG